MSQEKPDTEHGMTAEELAKRFRANFQPAPPEEDAAAPPPPAPESAAKAIQISLDAIERFFCHCGAELDKNKPKTWEYCGIHERCEGLRKLITEHAAHLQAELEAARNNGKLWAQAASDMLWEIARSFKPREKGDGWTPEQGAPAIKQIRERAEATEAHNRVLAEALRKISRDPNRTSWIEEAAERALGEGQKK